MKLFQIFISCILLMLAGCDGGSGAPSQMDLESDAEAISLVVTPAVASIPVGLAQQFIAQLQMADGSVIDVTREINLSWHSSDPEVASIDAKGNALGLTSGVVTITAHGTYYGKLFSSSVELTVTNAVVVGLQLTPAQQNIPEGFTQVYTAMAVFSDNTTKDVTQAAILTWQSSDPSIATISSGVESGAVQGVATALREGEVTITASGTVAGEPIKGTATLVVSKKSVVSLQLTPAVTSVPVGLTQPFVAQAQMSDGSVIDVTREASLSWHSSNPEIATIDAKGNALGVTSGVVTITAHASYNGEALSATATLTITTAVVVDLQLTPIHQKIPVGLTQAYIATAIFSDSTTKDVTQAAILTWQSSDPSIATISSGVESGAIQGVATALREGEVTITASGNVDGEPIKATTTLIVTKETMVSLQVTPDSFAVPKGLTKQFIATAIFSDGSTIDVTNEPAITWSSSSGAKISTGLSRRNGIARGLSVGDAMITASGNFNGHPFVSSAVLTVTDAVVVRLQITPANGRTPAGLTEYFRAIAVMSDRTTQDVTDDAEVSWLSEDTDIATVTSSDSKGVVTGLEKGITYISASGHFGEHTFSGKARLVVTEATPLSLEVTPTVVSTPVGVTQSFVAKVTMSDGSVKDVTNDPAMHWISHDTTVAVISSQLIDGMGQYANNGKAKAIATGNSTITANLALRRTMVKKTAELNVIDATIARLQVTPANDGVAKGMNKSFEATVILTDGTTQNVTNDPNLHWASNDIRIATVTSSLSSGNGLATGVNAGIAFIQASYLDGVNTFNAQGRLIVKEAAPVSLVVSPDTAVVPKGMTQQFTATVTFSDGTTDDVTQSNFTSWTTEGDAATVSSSLPTPELNGVARGEDVGSAHIIATYRSGKTTLEGKGQLSVTAPVVTGVRVSPDSTSIPKGLKKQFQAFAILSDSAEREVTNDPAISWSSDEVTIVTITSEMPGDTGNGIATGINSGITAINATFYDGIDTFRASASIEVEDAIARELLITPTSAYIPVGLTRNFTAQVIFTDDSTADVTNDVSWTSSDINIATISSSLSADNGQARGVKAGHATITAAITRDGLDLLSNTASLNVTDAIVTKLQVTPATSILPKGLSKQFNATAMLSDRTTKDVTNEVSWSVEGEGGATIASVTSSLSSGNGTVKGLNVGNAIINAKMTTAEGHDISALGRVKVTDAVPLSYRVTPKRSVVPLGLSSKFTAILKYSDGSVRDVSDDSATTWSSNNTSVVTVDAQDGTAQATSMAPTTAAQVSAQITSTTVIDGISYNDTSELALKPAIMTRLEITPDIYSLPLGLEYDGFKATAFFSDGSRKDVTHGSDIMWYSKNNAIINVWDSDTALKVTTVATGKAEVWAESKSTKLIATAEVNVISAVPVSLRLTPESATIPSGSKTYIKPILTLSDGSEIDSFFSDSSDILNWASVDPSIAVVTEASFNGHASGLVEAASASARGTTEVIATMLLYPYDGTGGSTSASATVEMTDAKIRSLFIQFAPVGTFPFETDKTITLHGGGLQTYAEATMTDGSSLDVTDYSGITWLSTVVPDDATMGDWDAIDDSGATFNDTGLLTPLKEGLLRVMAVASGDVTYDGNPIESNEPIVRILRTRTVTVTVNNGKLTVDGANEITLNIGDNTHPDLPGVTITRTYHEYAHSLRCSSSVEHYAVAGLYKYTFSGGKTDLTLQDVFHRGYSAYGYETEFNASRKITKGVDCGGRIAATTVGPVPTYVNDSYDRNHSGEIDL